MNKTIQVVRVVRVRQELVQQMILEVSVLHTNAMAENPWCEVWSNDLLGTDPRTNSPAMLRKLLEEKADFVFAYHNNELIGFGVGMSLTQCYLDSMEWGQAKEYIPRGPEPGDYEMNLVVVHPDYRGSGLMSQMAEARLSIAKEKLQKGRRIWVQTIPPENQEVCTSKVMSYYLGKGFQHSGELTIKTTRRVFLTLEV